MGSSASCVSPGEKRGKRASLSCSGEEALRTPNKGERRRKKGGRTLRAVVYRATTKVALVPKEREKKEERSGEEKEGFTLSWRRKVLRGGQGQFAKARAAGRREGNVLAEEKRGDRGERNPIAGEKRKAPQPRCGADSFYIGGGGGVRKGSHRICCWKKRATEPDGRSKEASRVSLRGGGCRPGGDLRSPQKEKGGRGCLFVLPRERGGAQTRPNGGVACRRWSAQW